MRPAVQRPAAVGQAFGFPAVLIQKAQQNLGRDNDPVAEVKQGYGGRGDLFRRHGRAEDLGRAGKINVVHSAPKKSFALIFNSEFRIITLTYVLSGIFRIMNQTCYETQIRGYILQL